MSLETVEGQNELSADTSEPASADGAPATFRGEIAAEADGFVALEARGEDGSTLRRMMGLAVRGDPPPFVEIRDPGRDLLLADGSAALDLVVEASDELGLDSLELVFTRVSGFGEVFDFEEGTVPLEIARESASRWVGRARWPLADLELDRGDIVVYHARARDRRPGSTHGESETYMVEVQGSEAGLSGGFAGEDDMDRYALSQQMLLVLTERLVARRDSIPEEAFDAEVQTLAAMQRRIRAEFVFMLGGELEDELDHETMGDEALAELHEEAHARADAAAAEGRLEQQGRLELTRAVQAMSHAAGLLSAVEMEAALEAEESAVIFLQRAFSSSRYILRAMSEREQLDASRRLTGALGSAARDVRPRVEPAPEPGVEVLREALGRVAEWANVGGASGVEEDRAQTLRDLARAVLAIDPSAEGLQAIASVLTDASDALANGRDDAARDLLADAADALVAAIRGGLAPAPGAAPSLEERRLDGALADALSGALGGTGTDGGGP